MMLITAFLLWPWRGSYYEGIAQPSEIIASNFGSPTHLEHTLRIAVDLLLPMLMERFR